MKKTERRAGCKREGRSRSWRSTSGSHRGAASDRWTQKIVTTAMDSWDAGGTCYRCLLLSVSTSFVIFHWNCELRELVICAWGPGCPSDFCFRFGRLCFLRDFLAFIASVMQLEGRPPMPPWYPWQGHSCCWRNRGLVVERKDMEAPLPNSSFTSHFAPPSYHHPQDMS